jgi:hypothetical protein
MITMEQVEKGLTPSLAIALDIIRDNPLINRYQADIHYGHGSLTQRVSELREKGFLIDSIEKTYIDLQGNERHGVAHYVYQGWKEPSQKAA